MRIVKSFPGNGDVCYMFVENDNGETSLVTVWANDDETNSSSARLCSELEFNELAKKD